MNEQLVLFEGQEEIKVKTDQGETLINLASTGTICGIIKKDNKRGTERIRWIGERSINEKLLKIRENLVESMCGTNVAQENYQKYIDEIDYISDEIENGNDRNSIFMSSWMTKRLAMNCSSQKAEQYKNFLATLDEKYSNGEITYTREQLSKIVSDTVNGIIPVMVKGITEQFAPIIVETKNIVDTQKKNNETAQENLERLIGIRSRNTNCIGKKLTARESEFYGRRIYATAVEHKLNRNKLLNHFNVMALEDIPARKYNDILDYVENMELVPVKEVEKYKTTPRSNKCEYLKLVEAN